MRLNQKNPPELQEVTFDSKDGIKLYADYYESKKGKSAPLIMLFHLGGGDVRDEYASIIPELQKLDYNIIATDTCAGGDRFGTNRTMANIKKEFGCCDAYQDLESALEFAKSEGFTGKKIAWLNHARRGRPKTTEKSFWKLSNKHSGKFKNLATTSSGGSD